METSAQPLRILAVFHSPWDPRLGGPRVWIELADEWRAAGHQVDRYCLDDAFPKPSTWRVLYALQQIFFARRAAAFVRKNAAKYDVIDALLGDLPYSKQELHFHGLLVARSVGLTKLYAKFDSSARQRWPNQAKGRLAGRIFYILTTRRALKAADTAIRCADLVNLPNPDEELALRREVKSETRALVEPYGLSHRRAAALQQAAASSEIRLTKKCFSFIGTWTVRKGSQDWREIVHRLRAEIPGVTFRFLGTMAGAQTIHKQVGLSERELEVLPEYQPDDLPKLLSDCCLGIFPSYAEGFGLGVLEQLAAGVPTIAYNVSGPRQILEPLRDHLLVPPGDIDRLVRKISALLFGTSETYNDLSNRCVEVSQSYRWKEIARSTIDSYKEELGRR